MHYPAQLQHSVIVCHKIWYSHQSPCFDCHQCYSHKAVDSQGPAFVPSPQIPHDWLASATASSRVPTIRLTEKQTQCPRRMHPFGSRAVIPPPGRDLILNELYETHPGTSKMKALARSYIWWPGMDMAIEQTVKSCQTCQESRPAPAVAPLHPWEWPSQPWSRLHLDFAGAFLGHMYLVFVDAHSKWLDVHIMNSVSAKTIEVLRTIFAASAKTIEVLRTIFATH